MYRQRIHFFPKTMDAFITLSAVGDEYNKLAADKGMAQGSSWMPTVGENELVWEIEYPDLATFERESKEMFTDPDWMGLMQRVQAIEYSRPPYNELLEPAPSVA